MGIYLNPGISSLVIDKNDQLYVDKSLIISNLNSLIDTKGRFICVSRPRRFGKSMAANMIAAYYSKGVDSHEVFSDLDVSKESSFEKYINKFNVFKIDMNSFYMEAVSLKQSLSALITSKLLSELFIAFPSVDIESNSTLVDAINRIYTRLGERFVFVIDEYDVVIREEAEKTILDDYMSFLVMLFKNSNIEPAIALVYLTGILPIVRDKVQSKFNNFDQYTMLNAGRFSQFVGFTSSETEKLCIDNKMNYDDIKRWYDGYDLRGVEIYSPKSVVSAIINGYCDDYWTQTGSYDVLKNNILMNFDGIKDDVIAMISGERISVDAYSFLNSMTDFRSKDDVFTYLIHLGYLAYDSFEQKCYIPNREVREEWIRSIKNTVDYKSVIEAVDESRKLLEATWNMDSDMVVSALVRTHMLVTSNLTYNNEGSFQSAICLAYFYADAYYTVVTEMPAGKGYADVVFIPFVPDKPAIIVELKRNDSVDTAINQIKSKNYPDILKKYKGNILLVGISYSTETKEHFCKIEKA